MPWRLSPVVSRAGGPDGRPEPSRSDPIEVAAAVPVGDEEQAAPVGQPDRAGVERGGVRDPLRRAARRRHDPDRARRDVADRVPGVDEGRVAAHEGEARAVGRPGERVRLVERGDPGGGPAARRPHVDLALDGVRDPPAVGRPGEIPGPSSLGATLGVDEQLRRAAEGGDHVDRAAHLEAEPGPVGRPARPVLVAVEALGDGDGAAADELTDVDPHLPARARGIGHELAVGREVGWTSSPGSAVIRLVRPSWMAGGGAFRSTAAPAASPIPTRATTAARRHGRRPGAMRRKDRSVPAWGVGWRR